MSTVSGVIHHGKVIPDHPIEWAEGTRVNIVAEFSEIDDELSEEAEATDPATIRRWIAALEALPPLEMTEQEEQQWKKGLEEMNQKATNALHQKVDGLFP